MNVYEITGRGYDSNIYILLDEQACIVDAGTGSYHAKIKDTIQRYVDLNSVIFIIATHEHFDHTGGIEYLSKICPHAQVCMHKNCMCSLQRKRQGTYTTMGGQMPPVHRILKDGDFIEWGSSRLEVIYTPGHSLGSICLYDKKTETLISGDLIFYPGDVGRTDLEGGDINALVDSLKKLLKLKIKNIYPGHGPSIIGKGIYHLNLSYQNALSYL
jgi:glyoxylase-like metal-dependent hydrolase (beta-lactamase superfamily II)